MTEQFADAFKRYWAVIVTVAVIVAMGLLYAGQLYVGVRTDIQALGADIAAERAARVYGEQQNQTVREGLLERLESRIGHVEDRVTKLESAP